VKWHELGVARGDRANFLPGTGRNGKFCGLCLGMCLGWKLGQESSLSSDTNDVPSKEMEKLSLQKPKQSKNKDKRK